MLYFTENNGITSVCRQYTPKSICFNHWFIQIQTFLSFGERLTEVKNVHLSAKVKLSHITYYLSPKVHHTNSPATFSK